MYAGGTFTIANVTPRNNIARIDTATNTLSDFDPNVNSTVNALLLSGGTLYAGGWFTSVNGNMPRSRLAGFDVSQPIDGVTGFNPNVSDAVNALAMAGTTLYAGGNFTQVNGSVPRSRLASFDTTLNVSNVTGSDPNLNGNVQVLVLAGSRLYTGGSFTSVGGTTRNRLAALNTASPSLAPTAFDPNVNSTVYSLLLSGSTLYAGGAFSQVNGTQSRGSVAAFTTALDTGNALPFNPVTNGSVFALAKSSNTLFVGGTFTTVNNNAAARGRLAAFDTTQPTSNVTSFDPSVAGTVTALSTGSGTLDAGGAFTTVRSRPQSNVTRFSVPAVGQTTWTEANNTASTPVAIDDKLLVGDADNATLTSATVSITGNHSPTEDVLSFSNDVLNMGNIAVASNSGGVLTLTSAGATATVAQWQAALRAVKYDNTSQTPSTVTRTVDVAVSDGNSTSAVAQRQVIVVSLDDSPTVATTTGNTTWLEDRAPSSPTVVDAAVDVADIDSDNLRGATVSIGSGFVSAQDVLDFTPQNGITGTYNVSAGVLSLSGTATKEQWAAALRSVTYDNLSNSPAGAARTISFAAADATSTGRSQTRPSRSRQPTTRRS